MRRRQVGDRCAGGVSSRFERDFSRNLGSTTTSWQQTDKEGRFVFDRVPPVKCSLSACLTVWEEFPIRSSQSVPLDLQPGEDRTVELGGEGVMVTGRVKLAGDTTREIDLNYSLNYVLRMRRASSRRTRLRGPNSIGRAVGPMRSPALKRAACISRAYTIISSSSAATAHFASAACARATTNWPSRYTKHRRAAW